MERYTRTVVRWGRFAWAVWRHLFGFSQILQFTPSNYQRSVPSVPRTVKPIDPDPLKTNYLLLEQEVIWPLRDTHWPLSLRRMEIYTSGCGRPAFDRPWPWWLILVCKGLIGFKHKAAALTNHTSQWKQWTGQRGWTKREKKNMDKDSRKTNK